MKAVRSLIAIGALFSAAMVPLHAQIPQQIMPPGAVEFIFVARGALYQQTGVSTVTPDTATPFGFFVEIEGFNMTSTSPLTAASFNWPGGSSTPLAFDTWDNDWTHENTSFASMAALNGVYGTGTYSISMTGTPTATIGIVVDSFANSTLQIPQLTLTGGTWMGNAYVLGATDSLTITFNSVYTGTAAETQGFHYDAWLEGGDGYSETKGFINYDPTQDSAVSGGATPAPWVLGVMPVGTYSLEVGYTEIQNPRSHFEGTIFSASLLVYSTSLQLVVVPEPSTYALMALGLGVIGLTCWRRRRA